jgi:hypothetical protein
MGLDVEAPFLYEELGNTVGPSSRCIIATLAPDDGSSLPTGVLQYCVKLTGCTPFEALFELAANPGYVETAETFS